MRIIGGHDYYDSALAFGRDTETVFIRHKKNSNRHKLGWNTPTVYHTRDLYYKPRYFAIVVYFCDTIYRGIHHVQRAEEPPYFQEKFIWNGQDIDPDLLEESHRLRWRKDELPYEWILNKESIEEYFIPEKMNQFEINRMIEGRIAIAYWKADNSKEYLFNVNEEGLKDIGFQKAVDPWTAFQELSMWVGGVLPRDGNPMVEITDNKMKIEKAGFDNKVSFRHPFKD